MPNKNYVKGRRMEYDVMAFLRQRGFKVYRTAGSHSETDVIAILDSSILFIQCKNKKLSTATKLHIWKGMEKAGLYGYLFAKSVIATKDYKDELKALLNEED